jgi:hypothetical protein
MSKCKLCQFENNKHSLACKLYKEPKNPMKNIEEFDKLEEWEKELHLAMEEVRPADWYYSFIRELLEKSRQELLEEITGKLPKESKIKQEKCECGAFKDEKVCPWCWEKIKEVGYNSALQEIKTIINNLKG